MKKEGVKCLCVIKLKARLYKQIELSSRMDVKPFAIGLSNSEYHIDFDRGIITHSQMSNRQQENRIFRRFKLNGMLGHLSSSQANQYYTSYNFGQKYLMLLRRHTVNEISKLSAQASLSYALNHMGVIGQNYLTLQYPVTQTTGVGFVRSALDRQKIVDYAEKLAIQSFNYAQSTNDVNISTGEARLITDEVARQKILRDLRSIAFSTQ